MKQSKSIAFDTIQFVKVSRGYITPPKPMIWPKSLYSIKECMQSAIFMANQIELVEYCLSTSRPENVRPAYFRASLSELCRVEDIVKAHGVPLSFYNSNDPSLHIVKLLRNYQIHIAATKLSSGHTTIEYSGEQMIYHSFIVENVTASELQKLSSAKDYSDKQLNELANLFNSEQRKLGVVQLLYHLIKRVEEYTECNLPNHLRPNKNSRVACDWSC